MSCTNTPCVSLLLNKVYVVYIVNEKINSLYITFLYLQQFFLLSHFHEALAAVYSSLNLLVLFVLSGVVSLSQVDVALNVLYLSGVGIIDHICLSISIITLHLIIFRSSLSLSSVSSCRFVIVCTGWSQCQCSTLQFIPYLNVQ